MDAILIRPDSSWIEVTPKNGKDFKLEELYSMLKCEYVELATIPYPNLYMIVDEEGWLKDTPVLNKLASRIYKIRKNAIVGTVLLCNHSQFK